MERLDNRFRSRIEEVRAEVREVAKETSDRACILLGGAMLERRLLSAINLRLPEGVAPVSDRSTLNYLITEGLRLGVVHPDWREELERIARIRNRAAHQIEAGSFSSPDIQPLCEELQRPNAEHLRDRYLWTVSDYCLRLDMVGLVAERITTIGSPNFSQDPELRSLEMRLAVVLTFPSTMANATDPDAEDLYG